MRPTRSMSNSATPALRSITAALLCAFASLAASAQALPATAPTAMTAPIAATAPAVTATRPHRAEVLFADQQLTVRANDSSLHQILSSIARITGMKITGGVEEQRVFGSYGPASASTILATLLDGTGVNMLIREDDGQRPTELTLTPRLGGASSPITSQDEDIGNDQPVPQPAAYIAPPSQPATTSLSSNPTPTPQPTVSGPPNMPQPLNNPLGNPNNVTPTASQIPTVQSVSTDSLPKPSTATQPVQGIVDTPNQTPTGATGAVTPDQIYQKLLQMQKDKAAQAAGTSTTPPQ